MTMPMDTVGTRLRNSGYECAVVGKWSFGDDPTTVAACGFADYEATCIEPCTWQGCAVRVQGKEGRAEKYLTDWIADRTVEYLARPHQRPFFLWVGLRGPQKEPLYPPDTEKLYPPDSIVLPESVKMAPDQRPQPLNDSLPARQFREMNEQRIREARSKYYAMITHTDERIGRILKRVDELSLREKTVIIFTADHGYCLGDHQLFSSGPGFYEEMIRVPLVVRYGGVAEPDRRIDRIVSLLDIAPMCLDLAGVSVPMAMQGRSLLNLLHDPRSRDHADESFIEFDKQDNITCKVRGLVTSHYKFIEYSQGKELYDLKRDPRELHNASGDSEYAPVVKVLVSRLKRWQIVTRDPEYKK